MSNNPLPSGYQMTSVEIDTDANYIFIREDGPRPAVPSVDSAILRASAGRDIAFILALRSKS